METKQTQITAGQTLITRSSGDYDCVFSLQVISRTAKMATIKWQGQTRRAKIHSFDGIEYVQPENYSMAPIFRADRAA
jgi:hypothetical protein